MKRMIQFCFYLITFFSLFSANAVTQNVTDLLSYSDKARSGAELGMSWSVEIESKENGETFSNKYSVKTKGTSVLVETLLPLKNKGEKMLLKEHSMWFIKPSLRKPVSISVRQRLTGQTANGDIASTRYSRDYEGSFIGEEKINGENAYQLMLKAKDKSVTYDQIRYWIHKETKTAVKADFLTLSGQTLKSAVFEYKNSVEVNKEKIPFVSKMTITDHNNPSNQSVIIYKEIRAEEHPDRIFNINNIDS